MPTCATKTIFLLSYCIALGACSSGEVVSTTDTPDTPVANSTEIYDVQGAGRTSPLAGQTVTVSGVVTGDFQDDGAGANLGGFFVQAQTPDGNADTSDGVFVYDGAAPLTDVNEGEVVLVRGIVAERFGETQITAVEVTITGNGSILPTNALLPAGATVLNSDSQNIADFERFEGMLVRFEQSLTISELYDLERFGEVLLTSGGRLFQFTNTDAPSVPGYADRQQQQALRSLRLSDGNTGQNVRPIRYLAGSSGSTLRIGDQVSFLVGNIRFSRGSGGSGTEAYRIVPMDDPQFTVANPRPTGSPLPGSELKVASFNLLNFFSRIDTGERVCGPQGNSNCRGANSSEEFGRQLEKTVTALHTLDADIVGLIELENEGSIALQLIIDALNDKDGPRSWSFVDTGNVGSDAIRNAFIYDSTRVTASGDFAVIDSSVDARFNSSRNRPSIAQTFQHTGQQLTIVINHLKSKGSSCNDIGDPDLADGQSNCNQTRAAATAAIADWLAQDPTGSGDGDFLVIGDLNAYLEEDPVSALEQAGYTNLLRIFRGSDTYSYVYRGTSGAMDHALASPSLATQVRDALEWHINVDEPPALDYNLDFGRDAALFDPSTPYRSADHDPIVISLDLH